MKKLARLTALLLTGALLLVLTACGAAPLTPEQQAKQQILAALNEYRQRCKSGSCGSGALQSGTVLGRCVPQRRGLQGSVKQN